jgi:predicted GNAT family acetyltransferase
MHLKTYTDAGPFLNDVQAYLEPQEVVNGLMLGLARHLVEEPLAYGSAPYFALVMGIGGPTLAALMTPPYNLILYSERENPVEALDLLADDLIAGHHPVSGTLGSPPMAGAFAELWMRRTGAGSRPGMHQRLYQLRQVIRVSSAPGRLRPATESDAGLILEWMCAFEAEAMRSSPRTSLEMVRGRIAESSVFLWEDAGPACMAVKTRPTQRGVSISWVYTPPERRRRGYASACVAALSQRLLDSGFEYCTLFTDLDNPTSNDIYQQVGYRPVCDFLEIKFT